MNNIYVDLNEIKNFNEKQPTIITVSEAKEEIYKNASLHQDIESWISAHQRDKDNSFGKLLFSKVIMETCEILGHEESDNDIDKDLLPLVKNNISEFYAQLLMDGVLDKDKNRQNLENFLQSMYNSCQKILDTHEIVMGDDDEDAILKIRDLAQAKEEHINDYIDEEEFNYYNEADTRNFASILARSEYLISIFDSSRILNRMAGCFMDCYDLESGEIYGDTKIKKSKDELYTVSKEYLRDFPEQPKIGKCKLNSKNILEIDNEEELNFEAYKKLFKKHDIIKYKNKDGSNCYSIFNPKMIKFNEKEIPSI